MIPFLKRREHISDADLSAYIDGELTAPEAARVLTHLQRCADCGAILEGLRSVASMLAALPAEAPSRSFILSPAQAGIETRRQTPRRFAVPAFAPAVAMTIFVALLAVDLLPSSGSSDDEVATDRSVFSTNREAVKESAGAGALADSAAPAPAVPAPATGAFAPTPAAEPQTAPARSLAPEAPGTGTGNVAPPAEPTMPTLQRLEPVPTPAPAGEAADTIADAESDSDASISLLRLLQIGAALAFVVSLVAVIVTRSPGRRTAS
jgi:anti-sigma factor RsiW